MKFKAAPFDARRLQGTTLHNKGYLVEYIAKANAAERDSNRAERIEKGECRYCFYCKGKAGGSACSSRPCACCGVEVYSANTCIDVLCKPCADKHELCVHCGADRELRARRKNWPNGAEAKSDKP